MTVASGISFEPKHVRTRSILYILKQQMARADFRMLRYDEEILQASNVRKLLVEKWGKVTTRNIIIIPFRTGTGNAKLIAGVCR